MVAEDTQRQFIWSKPIFKNREEEGKRKIFKIIFSRAFVQQI